MSRSAPRWYGDNQWMIHGLWLLLSLTLIFVTVIHIKLSIYIHKRLKREATPRRKNTGPARHLNIKVTIFSLCGLTFYVIAIIVFLAAEICQDSYSWTGYPYPFICITWGSANIFAYLLYIHRLRVGFDNTAYATSSGVYYLFYFLILLFLLSQILETILNVGEVYNFLSVKTAQVFFIATFGWDQLIDGIMSVMLLAIFIHKLFSLTIDTVDVSEDSFSEAAQSMFHRKLSVQLDENQRKFLKLATKQFVLSTYAIISTQSYIFWNSFSGVVYSDIVWEWNDDVNYGLYVICVILFCNDCISNAIAIYLNFSFNDRLYGKVCKSCDRCCGYCCVRLAKRKAKQKIFASSDYLELRSMSS